MAVLRFLWKAIGVMVALQLLYFAAMYFGAWMGWVKVPNPGTFWLVFAFTGACMFELEMVFPQLKE